MAFSTRQQLRERLNGMLGIEDGDDKPWGDADARDNAIRWGLEQLEPVMQRLVEEAITVATDTRTYTLTSITKVVLVEQVASNGAIKDLTNYRSITVDGVTRLTFRSPLSTSTSVNVIGYVPYTSYLATQATEADIPDDIEWIPLQGALAELYRRRFHEWIDFEKYNASNPSTVVEPDVIYRAYTDALAKFEQAKLDHMRSVVMPRRARFSRE